ncbi:hypothetical protein MSAN_02120600 [Mycena sanguinolenta]|uniref:Uncharacterized protein n=1 Tax=Mycena sanguinolenta TaxID=230812 RepID=A0A8H6XHA0_9AGAR|nr:hypothetical protein MSAN_02120600 [Mycena sanguinolenta]
MCTCILPFSTPYAHASLADPPCDDHNRAPEPHPSRIPGLRVSSTTQLGMRTVSSCMAVEMARVACVMLSGHSKELHFQPVAQQTHQYSPKVHVPSLILFRPFRCDNIFRYWSLLHLRCVLLLRSKAPISTATPACDISLCGASLATSSFVAYPTSLLNSAHL